MAELKTRIIIDQILKDMPDNQRLFRINAGQGWVGEDYPLRPATGFRSHLSRHDVIIKKAQVLHAAPKGWPDLCGWESKIVTEDMIGQVVAGFIGIEVKTPTVKVTKAQKLLGDLIRRMGGIWREVRE